MIAVAYQLYTIDGDEKVMVEETSGEQPFVFLSGFGFTLDKFEESVVGLADGEEFDFKLTPEEAYGEYMAERVLDLDKEIFSINGHFDHDNIYKDAIVPLQNEDGNRFMGKVLEVTSDKVKVDLNHPLAGKELNFVGHIVENRDATDAEIEQFLNHLNGGGCGCGCDDCGGGCDHEHGGCDHEHGDDCCGHHHHDGEGCGHHHHHDGEGCCHHKD